MVQSRAFSVLLGSRHLYLLGPITPEEAMASIYRASYVSLHVRKSNRAALGLYRDTLGFTLKDIEKSYCSFFPSYLALALSLVKLQMPMAKMHTQCTYHLKHDIYHGIYRDNIYILSNNNRV